MSVSHRARRLVATVAITGAAVLVPAVAVAASSGPAVRQNLGRCLVGETTDWLGLPGFATDGSIYYQLEISNTSGEACTLQGYPTVYAWGHGKRLGSTATRRAEYATSLLTLQPEATAHVVVQIAHASQFSAGGCQPEQAQDLQVYAPGAKWPQLIPLTFEACAKHGPVVLQVTTTLAGVGIPGYNG
jgi:hypothetical protein